MDRDQAGNPEGHRPSARGRQREREERTTRRNVRETFQRDPSEVGRARRHVAQVLSQWGMDSERSAVQLAVSELVSNAMTHGSGTIVVDMGMVGDRIRLEVHDCGAEDGRRPQLRQQPPGGPHAGGWGLRFVDKLADVWGADSRDGHTLVWMERRPTRPGDGDP